MTTLRSKIVIWETHTRKNQQWFVQPSGAGHRFKNCQHGNYLSVANTDLHSLVYASRFPTTWVLLKFKDGYFIRYPDNNKVFDLHFGWGHNGNEIHMHVWPRNGDPSNKIWKLERTSDETGEELPIIFQAQAKKKSGELQAEIKNSIIKDEQIETIKQELEQKSQAIELMEGRLAQKDLESAEKEDMIRRLLSEKEALRRICEENETIVLLKERQLQLENELSQQQTRVASLEGKVDRLEYIASQVNKV